MTKKEVTIMLGYFKTAYKHLINETNPTATINNWYEMFCDEESILVEQAMKKHVQNNIYPPSISELLDLVEKEKWVLYSEAFFDIDGSNSIKKIPKSFLPRSITGIKKSFELKGAQKIDAIITQENEDKIDMNDILSLST